MSVLVDLVGTLLQRQRFAMPAACIAVYTLVDDAEPLRRELVGLSTLTITNGPLWEDIHESPKKRDGTIVRIQRQNRPGR